MTVVWWSALVGFLTPTLVSVVIHESWRPLAKAMVALATSALAGTITALLSGGLTGVSWAQAIGVAFGASQFFYHTWWKNSEISDWIEREVNLFTGRGGAEPVLGGSPGESGNGKHSIGSE